MKRILRKKNYNYIPYCYMSSIKCVCYNINSDNLVVQLRQVRHIILVDFLG